jgi:hypothetical protein
LNSVCLPDCPPDGAGAGAAPGADVGVGAGAAPGADVGVGAGAGEGVGEDFVSESISMFFITSHCPRSILHSYSR